MKRALFLLALLPALASAETAVGLHLGSQHYPAKGQNNVNPGLYVRSADGWTAGAYHNSHRKLSAYAGRTWDRDFYGIRPAVTLGVITGYRHAVLPMLIPSVATPAIDGWRGRLTYVPRFEKNSTVLHLSIERGF